VITIARMILIEVVGIEKEIMVEDERMFDTKMIGTDIDMKPRENLLVH